MVQVGSDLHSTKILVFLGSERKISSERARFGGFLEISIVFGATSVLYLKICGEFFCLPILSFSEVGGQKISLCAFWLTFSIWIVQNILDWLLTVDRGEIDPVMIIGKSSNSMYSEFPSS